MTLKDLVGRHILSGVEFGRVSSERIFWVDVANCIKFILDGVTYVAIEDPDDGYRSYMGEIKVSDEPCSTPLPDIPVVCRMSDDPRKTLLIFTDANNGEDIMLLGTSYVDDWYPCCIMQYFPEKMSCNANRNERNGQRMNEELIMLYRIVADECKYTDTIYEEQLIELVGADGIALLEKHCILESCGQILGRKIYIFNEIW